MNQPNIEAAETPPGHRRRLRTAALFLLATLTLGACGDGSEGNSSSRDPVVIDHPIAYIKRPLTVNGQGTLIQPDARRLITFEPGAGLYLRERAAASAAEHNITDRAFQPGELYDVRDLEVSFDGDRLLFAMRGPYIPNADDEDQPRWNIWEYDIATDALRRVIPSDINAEAGHDLVPHYLPDGRIVFSSTRQRQAAALLLDEGKPQFAAQEEDLNEQALVLHVMNADGSDIHQISFNQSHDRDVSVTQDGRILFTRWDHMGGINRMNLYRANPDGTNLEVLYGVHSHDTGTAGSTVQFLHPRETATGRILALLAPYTGTQGGGDLVLIDTTTYSDNTQPTWNYLGLSGPAQTSATINTVRTDGQPSPGGRYRAAFPLQDGTNRLLVSWSPCRLMEAGLIVPCTPARLAAANPQEAAPLYGIWMYDMDAATQVPLLQPTEGIAYTDVVAAQPRALHPAIIFDKSIGVELDADLVSEGVGILDIRSVYDVDGTDSATPNIATLADPAQTTAVQRPARFLRVVKAVGIPDREVHDFAATAYGRSRQQLMREIVAYAPIEPDGSVRIKVPANVPFAVSVVDAEGKRIGGRHQNWLQLRPGEVLSCTGCHSTASTLAHGRSDARPPSVHAGSSANGVSFPNTEAALWTNLGETMAQTRTRLSCMDDCAALRPSVDLIYEDVWTDPGVRAKDAPYALRYADLNTAPPTSAGCQTAWNSACRIVINYEQHIHPLWSLPRNVGGNDRTCTACHSATDGALNPQVPAAQLDLGDGPSSDEPRHFKSYRELLYPDNEQDIIDGSLQDVLIPATDGNGDPIYQTDANGDPLLDGNGDPIPVLVPIAVTPAVSTAGAAASSRFFNLFSGSHTGDLTAAELRLIAEWLDIGAQYYNNPFDAPLN